MRSVFLCTAALLLAARVSLADNAPDRVRRHEPRMSYLDNGVIRLGIDLSLGGSITYLSRSGSDENVVNSYDCGRQIQMSYYSGPVPFSVPGKQPKPQWTHIGWNPIQVGDAFGNPSRVLSEENDGKHLYVKCVPMHWPLDDVPGECTYQCWLELEGNVVHARCRMENHRTDHTQYPGRFQEFPAIYTNGPWYRLTTYAGDQPFTGGPLKRIEKDKSEPGPWSHWAGTEHWAALTDDHDFGLGVWSPDTCNFDGGFAGTPGAGGPHDNPTGYVAPHGTEIIDWNIEHEYRYDLILGKLDEIRRYVYDHAPRPTPPAYHFEKDRQGWTYANAADTGWPIRGELNVRLEKNNPQMISPVSFWRASEAGTVCIEAASHTDGSGGRIYWRKLGERKFSPEESLPFKLQSDGAFHLYRMKLSDSPEWNGAMVQLRIDPTAKASVGDWIRVRSVTFEK